MPRISVGPIRPSRQGVWTQYRRPTFYCINDNSSIGLMLLYWKFFLHTTTYHIIISTTKCKRTCSAIPRVFQTALENHGRRISTGVGISKPAVVWDCSPPIQTNASGLKTHRSLRQGYYRNFSRDKKGWLFAKILQWHSLCFLQQCGTAGALQTVDNLRNQAGHYGRLDGVCN